MGVSMVDASVLGQIGVGMGGHRDERLQVIAKDFGGNVLDHPPPADSIAEKFC